MLTPFGPNLWTAEGPTVIAAAGFHYPTRMAVIRLASGGLVIWSPVALTPDLHAAVTALGPPRYLIPPNSLHDSFLADWHRAFPAAEILAPPGLARNHPDLPIAETLGQSPIPDWQGELDVTLVPGNRITTEAVLFHHPSRTAIFADLLQQFPKGWFTGWRALVARLDLMQSPTPQVPRKFRLAFTDRAAARKAVAQILEWPTQQILIAHGTPITTGGQAHLARAFRWLIR